MRERVKLKLTDSRFQGLRTHTKKAVEICPAIQTTTTGYLWWKKVGVKPVYLVMLAEEDTSYHAFLDPCTDYYWTMVDSFEEYSLAVALRDKILYGEKHV